MALKVMADIHDELDCLDIELKELIPNFESIKGKGKVQQEVNEIEEPIIEDKISSNEYYEQTNEEYHKEEKTEYNETPKLNSPKRLYPQLDPDQEENIQLTPYKTKKDDIISATPGPMGKNYLTS